MRPIISASSFRNASDCLRIQDIVYLPKGLDASLLSDTFPIPFAERPWFRALFHGNKIPTRELCSSHALFLIEHAYGDFRFRENAEPEWINELPAFLRGHLRGNYILGDGFEPLALVPGFPFTDVRYAIEEGGLIEAVERTFGLFRLQYVRQLGFLTDPVVSEEGVAGMGMLFNHTRLCHSYDVMAIATLIGANLDLPEPLLTALRVAAVSHDALTPAGGDTTKGIDPKAFDEDLHFPSLLKGSAWDALRENYHLRPQCIIDAVQGRGALGRILDIADKIAYVARDADIYIGRYDPSGPLLSSLTDTPSGYRQVCALVESHPSICGLWDSVQWANDEVCVGNVEQLEAFLLLRAFLFRELYYHPGARYREYILMRVSLQYLYDTGSLTREALLRMHDDTLEEHLARILGIEPHSFWVGMREKPKVEMFATRVEAEVREQALLAEGNLTILEEFRGIANAGTRLPVLFRGRAVPFREAHPPEAAQIEALMGSVPCVILYSIPLEELPSTAEFKKAIEHYRVSRRR